MAKLVPPRMIYDRLGLQDAPILIDVRSRGDVERLPRMIPGAMYFDAEVAPQWVRKLPQRRSVAIYSSAERDIGALASTLTISGVHCSILEGGIEHWLESQLPTIRMRDDLGVPGQSQWVTRERPKIDRLACPWLIRRFIDPLATFHYVPAQRVRTDATSLGAQPYDIPDVTFSHRGPNCSFDAFLDEFDLHDPILDELARIVRAADTATLDQAREAPGLLAISLGLSASIADDQLLLEQAMLIYDALYAWCKSARDEPHSWPKQVSAQ